MRRTKPFPWADFYIQRGHTLASAGQGTATSEELTALAAQARDIGNLAALPAIEAAMAEK